MKFPTRYFIFAVGFGKVPGLNPVLDIFHFVGEKLVNFNPNLHEK